jgi:hypothetical protein
MSYDPRTTILHNQIEIPMLYKTIVLELLIQNPEMHEQLRKDRKLLSALDLYSSELKTSHAAWKQRLSEAKPGSEQSQIANEAMEIAVKELEDHLRSESPSNEDAPLSLDHAMAYIRRHSPPE